MAYNSSPALVRIAVVLSVVTSGIACNFKKSDAEATPASASTPVPASSTPVALAASNDEELPKYTPKGMVLVKAGSFTMGDAKEPLAAPAHRVTISKSFFLDENEVTVGEYHQCVKSGRCTPALIHGPDMAADDILKHRDQCNARHADRKDHPVNCVDLLQAAAYCAFVGKRLPTEAEWEYAARGADARVFPWGNDKKACGKAVVSGCVRQPTDGTAGTRPVGSFPEGKSPWGALDMGGNVWEWVYDGYADYDAKDDTDPVTASKGLLGVIRGGSWDFASTKVGSAVRMKFMRQLGHVSAGFRCASAGTHQPLPEGKQGKPSELAGADADEDEKVKVDLKTLADATKLKLAGNKVVNDCGISVQPFFERLDVGGKVGEAIEVTLPDDAPGGTACHGNSGPRTILLRERKARLDVIFNGIGTPSVQKTSHHGVKDILVGGGGCEGLHAFDGKKYELLRREGPNCDDEKAASKSKDKDKKKAERSDEEAQPEASKAATEEADKPKAKRKKNKKKAKKKKE